MQDQYVAPTWLLIMSSIKIYSKTKGNGNTVFVIHCI